MNTLICPCKDCITLAMCKAMMANRFGFSDLSNKCSIFKEVYGSAYTYQMNELPDIIPLLQLIKPLHWKNRIGILIKDLSREIVNEY